MTLTNARRIIRELQQPASILNLPRFYGYSRDSDSLELARRKLLNCLAILEQNCHDYDEWLLAVLRTRLISLNYRPVVDILLGHRTIWSIRMVIGIQSFMRNELMLRLILIRRLIFDISRN